jgi:hypothetical protein
MALFISQMGHSQLVAAGTGGLPVLIRWSMAAGRLVCSDLAAQPPMPPPLRHVGRHIQPCPWLSSGTHIWYIANSRLQDGGQGAAPGPPYALMDAPPLAVFANGLAAALNELRHCPPLVLQQPVTAVVQVRVIGLLVYKA